MPESALIIKSMNNLATPSAQDCTETHQHTEHTPTEAPEESKDASSEPQSEQPETTIDRQARYNETLALLPTELHQEALLT